LNRQNHYSKKNNKKSNDFGCSLVKSCCDFVRNASFFFFHISSSFYLDISKGYLEMEDYYFVAKDMGSYFKHNTVLTMK